MIASLFVVAALLVVGLIVLAQGGFWGVGLFALALLAGISGMMDMA